MFRIAKLLESFMNNSYSAISGLEEKLGLEKDSSFYDPIDSYVSFKIDELTTAQTVFSQINQGVDAEAEYRKLRKASRGRWQGGGFGVGGAIKGAAEAGMMNMGTGAIHSVVNGLGNLKSELKASRQKSKVVRGILNGIPEKTKELLEAIEGLMIQKMEMDYPDCIGHNDKDAKRMLHKQFQTNPDSVETMVALLHRLERIDLLARTVLDEVYATREEAQKEARKVVGDKKFNTEEEAEAERERLRQEQELIEFETQEIEKLKKQYSSDVELLKILKIKKFKTNLGKQFEEKSEQKLLDFYSENKKSIGVEIAGKRLHMLLFSVLGIVSTLIGLGLFFRVGLILKIIIVLIVAGIWVKVSEDKDDLGCLKDIKSELKEIEDAFIIQNGALYLKMIKVKVIQKYKDKIIGRLLEPGEIIEVPKDRAEQLLKEKVVKKI